MNVRYLRTIRDGAYIMQGILEIIWEGGEP